MKLSRPWQYGLMKLVSISFSIESTSAMLIIRVSLLVIVPHIVISKSIRAAVRMC